MDWNLFKPSSKIRFPAPSDNFLQDLIATKGEDDTVLDRQIGNVLREVRFRRAVAPWITLLKSAVTVTKTPFELAWRETYGRYWKSRPPVHVSATLQSGGLSGTASGAGPLPAAGGPVNPVPFTNFSTHSPIGPGWSFEDAGIRAGEVIAYRCWLLRDGALFSAYMSEFKWEPDTVAEGTPTEHGEGIHAFKNRLDACQYVQAYEVDNYVVVSGTVELWGDVFEHSRGYRASRARIKSIDDSPNYNAEALRKQYKVNRKNKK